jgi:dipeptidase D
VCSANEETDHDFTKDALKLYIEGDWLKARNTTLGADDGIGVAACLALLSDPNAQYGPIEALFTGLFGQSCPFVLTCFQRTKKRQWEVLKTLIVEF